MASYRVALHCLRRQVRMLYFDEVGPCGMPDVWLALLTELGSSGDVFRLPKPMQLQIDLHIDNIAKKLRDWTSELIPIVFGEGYDNYKIIYEFVGKFVLEPSGSVLGIKTIRRLVRQSNLSNCRKFKMACYFCMENDVIRLWLKVSNESWLSKSNLMQEYPLVYYWSCRMKNELDTIHVTEGDNQGTSPEFQIIQLTPFLASEQYYKTEYFSSMAEFFFDKLKPEEQTAELFFNGREACLLSKLNRTQLQQVLTRSPDVIIKHLTHFEYTCEYALKIWKFMKAEVTLTCDQFFRILEVLCNKAFPFKLKGLDYGHADVLLSNIWIDAPQHLKDHILNNHVECFFKILENPLFYRSNECQDMRFFHHLLKNLPLKVRNMLWRKYWPEFVRYGPVSELPSFMKLCFENEEDIIEFREKNMLDFQTVCYVCSNCIDQGLSAKIIEYAKFCSSDAKRVEKFLQQIIQEKFTTNNIPTEVNSLREFLIHFIDGNDSAEQLKKNLIRDSIDKWCGTLFREMDDGIMTFIRTVVDCVLSSNQSYLIEIKRKVFEHRLYIIANSGRFNIVGLRRWDKFIKWCAPCDDFKRLFPVDRIFEIMVDREIYDLRHNRGTKFYGVEKFLRWYFDSVNKVKRYKLKRRIAILGRLQGENDYIFRKVVTWLLIRKY